MPTSPIVIDLLLKEKESKKKVITKHSQLNYTQKIHLIFSLTKAFLPLCFSLVGIHNKVPNGCYLHRYVEVIFHIFSFSYFYANYFLCGFPTFSQWNKNASLIFVGLCNLTLTNNLPLEDWFQSVFTLWLINNLHQFVTLATQLKLNTTSVCQWSPPFLNIFIGFLRPRIFLNVSTSSSSKNLTK